MHSPAPVEPTTQTSKRPLLPVESESDVLLEKTKAEWHQGWEADYDGKETAESNDPDEEDKKEKEGHYLASSSSSSGLITSLEQGWLTRADVARFLKEQRSHTKKTSFKIHDRGDHYYIEYYETKTGSKRHPCPAYDGVFHDQSNAKITAHTETRRLLVSCRDVPCSRRGAVCFQLAQTNARKKEGKQGQQESAAEETEGGAETENGESDERYVERLEHWLQQLGDTHLRGGKGEGEQQLPSIKMEEAIEQKKEAMEDAIDCFCNYWNKASENCLEFEPLNAAEAGMSRESLFKKRYRVARHTLMKRLTLFLNTYLCEVKAGYRRMYAVLHVLESGDKRWLLEEINSIEARGRSCQIEVPPHAMSWRVSRPKGVRSNVMREWIQNPSHRVQAESDYLGTSQVATITTKGKGVFAELTQNLGVASVGSTSIVTRNWVGSAKRVQTQLESSQMASWTPASEVSVLCPQWGLQGEARQEPVAPPRKKPRTPDELMVLEDEISLTQGKLHLERAMADMRGLYPAHEVDCEPVYLGFIQPLTNLPYRVSPAQARDWVLKNRHHHQLTNYFDGNGKRKLAFHIDHILPRRLGGFDHPRNYAIMPEIFNQKFGSWFLPAKARYVGLTAMREMLQFTEYIRKKVLETLDLSDLPIINYGC